MLVGLIDCFRCSVDQCRSVLKDHAAYPLTAASVARVIGMMTRHPSTAVDHTALQASSPLYFIINCVFT